MHSYLNDTKKALDKTFFTLTNNTMENKIVKEYFNRVPHWFSHSGEAKQYNVVQLVPLAPQK